MIMKRSLKLTAISAGIAAIALTGCSKDGKDGNNGSNGNEGKAGTTETAPTPVVDPKPTPTPTITLPVTDDKGNKIEINIPINAATGSFDIKVGQYLPSNGCIPVNVVYKNKEGQEFYTDITALSDDNNHHSSSVIRTVLSSKSQAKFKLKNGHLCVKDKADFAAEIAKSPNSETHKMDRFDAAEVGNTALIQVRFGDHIFKESPAVTVVDAQINSVEIKHGYYPSTVTEAADRSYKEFLIPKGKEAHFTLTGLATSRKELVGVKDQRNLKIELTEVNTNKVELVNAEGKVISTLKQVKGSGNNWALTTEGLSETSHYEAYTLRIAPNDSTELKEEIRIRVAPAVVVGYEVVGIQTNVIGKQKFEILAHYSDGSKAKSIREDEGNTPFKIKYNVVEVSAPTVSINSINLIDNLNTNVASLTKENFHSVQAAKDKSFYLDVGITPAFGDNTNNKFYKLTLEIEYNNNFDDNKKASLKNPNHAMRAGVITGSYDASWGNKVQTIERYFIVSKKKPVLRTSYKYLDTRASEATNNKFAVNLASTDPRSTAAVLPKGGDATDLASVAKKANLCVKADTELMGIYVDGSGEEVELKVDGYDSIARIMNVSENIPLNVLASKTSSNKHFSVYHESSDPAAQTNANIICATSKAAVGASVKINSHFQDLVSKNSLDVKVAEAINTPVIAFAFNKAGAKSLSINANSLDSIQSYDIVPYLVKSDGSYGDELIATDAANLTYSTTVSTDSPITIAKDTTTSQSKVEIASNKSFDAAKGQIQFVKFGGQLITAKKFTVDSTFKKLNDVYYPNFALTDYELENVTRLVTLNLADHDKHYYHEVDQFADYVTKGDRANVETLRKAMDDLQQPLEEADTASQKAFADLSKNTDTTQTTTLTEAEKKAKEAFQEVRNKFDDAKAKYEAAKAALDARVNPKTASLGDDSTEST